MSEVMTVLGPVDSNELGITLPHEHLFIDLSCLWHQPVDPAREPLVHAAVSAEARPLLLRDPYHCKDNLLLDDANQIVEELELYKSLGGRTIVDLSTRSIGPYPLQLKEVARQTGLNIIAGTGFYTKGAHPPYVQSADANELAQQMIAELSTGFPDTSIRAGIIGEIGTSSPIHPNEEKVLKAVAKAHNETGAGINIHLAIFGSEGNNVLDLLEAQGVNLGRVALSHLDENPQADYHLSLAERGCFLEFDCFGSEVHFDEDKLREPTDDERLGALLFLIERGYEDQLLLSQDVCTKMQLKRHGGMGYAHILQSIVPRLRTNGVQASVVEKMLIHNPRRLLA